METKSKPSAKKQAPAAMATKIKRAKVDSRKSSDQVGDDQQAVIARLQSELEVERKSNKQLRREKAVEVQQVREAEQTRSSASQKELATRLHLEKQKELEAVRESLRCRQEAEIVKAIKQKDLEIKRLQRDLLKCQDELKEEIAKRGLSTSARSAFELERAKLLQEIKELTSAKKQLEDALRAASDAEKQKNLEIRQMQENCKLEVAKVEKEAGIEVRKLLEELKSKDHLLAQMDRNQYPDRSQALRQHIANQSVGEIRNLSKELEVKKQELGAIATTTPTTTSGLQSIGWQKKIYELEKQIRAASGLNNAFIEKNKEFSTINNNLEGKIKTLTEENKELNCELTSAKAEMKKMNEFFSGSNMESLNKQLERLRKLIKDQELIIAQLRFDCWEKDRQMKLKARANQPKKAVRFLLPGETVPLAPGFDVDDVIGDGHNGDDSFGDDSADSASVDSSSSDATMTELSSQPSLSDMNLTDDDRELMEPNVLLENVEKDYELLMKEHLTLEQSYASLLHSYSVRVDGEQPPEEWKIERESLNLAIYALEQKVRRCEENEELLRIKLEQITEEKEELEFKVLEHQECSETVAEDGAQEHDAEILKKNEELASEVTQLQKKLEKYESAVKAPERHVGLQCDRLSENLPTAPAKIAATKPDCLELSAESLLDDIENDSGIEAALSTSTSSGFDETSSEAEEPALANDPHLPANPDEPMANVTLKGEDKKEKRMEEMGTIIKNFESMETTWKATVDKLERQLQQSFLRERIIRDQIALVEEEKNRRINTLQGQIDLLEDNESRLSDTIVALENVALGVEDVQGGMASNIAMADELDKDVEELDRRRKQLREEVEQLVEAGRILGQVKLRIAGHAKSGNSLEIPDETAACPSTTPLDDVEVVSLVDVVEKALLSSIMRLENVDHQLGEESRKEKEIGQRIRKLETDTLKGTANERKPLNTLQVRKAVAECSQVVSNFAVEELQSDLRELRGLLIRLKAVISVEEMESRGGSELDGPSPFSLSKSKEARARLHLDLMLDGSKVADDWLAMTPPSGVKMTSEFGDRDNDATEFQLRQKVDELEKDCDRLQKFAHEEEQVIRDMHFQNLELRNSEKNLQHMVERLESSEEQMHGKMEEMAEEMENLQVQVKQLETRERLAKSQVAKHQESEAELEERLEQTIEEMQSGKQKMERKILELENDKKSLIRKTEEQADRIGDLEGLSGSLKQRIKNLETSESSLRQEMRKMEAELSSAAGQLSELEQQKELLVQQLQDLEKEKSKLLFEIADLTMDSNKQGHKITLLNQEIGKLRESLVGKGEVIACLQTKLEEATGMLEGLRMKLTAYETAELEASVNENKQSVTEIKKQGCEALTCQQSTQTSFERLKAKIVIEKATSGFRDTLLSLGERHPRILREFLSASLLPLLDSRESLSGDSAIPEETMKRFVSSLRVEIPCGPSARLSNGNHLESLDGNGKEEKHWTEVEDLDVVRDVRCAENSTNWKEIEGRMGFNTDDLALTIEFRDTVEMENEDHTDLSRINKGSQSDDGSNKSVPPPLPDSSPPRLAPELCVAEESADEASDIDDEDDGAVPLGDSIAPNWKVPYCVPAEQSDQLVPPPQQLLRPSSGISHAEPIALLDSRFERARSVDRDYFPLNKNASHGSELRRMVTGSLESITDSGLDSMRQGTMAIPEEASRQKNRNSIEDKRLLKDQAIQTNGRELHEPVIILKTQLEEREKELIVKSNEMDLLSQEMRHWQREAVAAGEERTRLSALLGCALKDLKVIQESNGGGGPEVKSLTTATMLAKIQKSPLGLPSWGLSFGAEKMRPVSHIPVRHSSINDRDFAVKCQSSTALRPTSLHSSDQRQSSTDSVPPNSDSDSGSGYASPSQDRMKSVSYLPRPVNQPGPGGPSVGTSSRKEADRLFRQSFDSPRNSQSRQSASSSSPSSLSSSPSQSVPEPVSDGLKCLQAVEPATSRGEGATVL